MKISKLYSRLKANIHLKNVLSDRFARIKNRIRMSDEHTREIMSKGSVAFVLKIIGAGLGFSFQVAIARFFGASGAGVYFLAVTIVTFVAMISRLGMDNSVTRFVAANAADKAWNRVTGVTRLAVRITLAVALLTSLVLVATAGWLANSVFDKPGLTTPLRIMALAVLPLALMTLYANSLQGLKRVRDSMLMLNVWIPLLAGISLFAIAPRFGVEGAVVAYAIGVVFSLIYGLLMWRQAKSVWGETSSEFPIRTLLASSFPLLGVIGMNQFMQAFPTLLLGALGSSADVGLFSSAQRTAALVSMVLVAANSIVAPKFAALYQQGDMVTLDKVARRGALMMTVMAAPVLIVFLLAPQWVMGLFGSEFSSGWLLLVIMALGQLVNVATGSVGFLLIMTGHEKNLFTAVMLATGINAVLCVVLIPFYGAVGAAVATSVSLSAVNLLRVYYVWHTMGIMTLPLVSLRRGSY